MRYYVVEQTPGHMATIQIHGTPYRICVMGYGVQMLNAYDCLLHDDMGHDVSGLPHDTASICLVDVGKKSSHMARETSG